MFARFLLPLLYAGLAGLFGIALGERGELGAVQHVFTAVIPLATVVLTVVSRKGKLHAAVTGAVMLAGLLLGQREFDRAWNECRTEGETVRRALLAYESGTGAYPARLEELPGTLPCRCLLRPTILHYLSNDRGFRLWLSDDRELLVATDRAPFTASGRSSNPPRR